MKKIIMTFLSLCLVCISANSQSAGVAGLSYETYRGTGAQPSINPLVYPTVLSTGISQTINFNWGGNMVLNSGRSEQVIVKWTGYINVTTSGTYYFGGNADDGLIIRVNNTSVVDSWIESGGAFRSGSIFLSAGVLPIEVWYYENGGGAMVNLQWYTPTEPYWQIVPSSSLATDQTFWVPPGPTVFGGTITQTNAPATQTITSGASSSASPTAAEISRINSWNNSAKTYDNYLYIDQISGNNNTVNVTQSGGPNKIEATISGTGSNTINLTQSGSSYLKAIVNGQANNLTSNQSNTQGSNYAETTVIGNSNAVNHTQSGNASQLLFSNISGSNNTVTSSQSGTAQHYLNVNLLGNGHTVLSTQTGSSSNNATLDLTNNGGPSTVDLQQTGGKNLSIIQGCTNPAGCSTVIRQ